MDDPAALKTEWNLFKNINDSLLIDDKKNHQLIKDKLQNFEKNT